MSSRIENARRFRDLALEILQRKGYWTKIAGGPNMQAAKIGNIGISHRTPFSKLPAPDRAFDHILLNGKLGENLPYGLDIWYRHKKVLNVEWDAEKIEVVSLRPGEWQLELEAAAGGNQSI